MANMLGSFLRDIEKILSIQWRDSTVNFQLDNKYLYCKQLQDFITSNAKLNERTLFVFDEFDKMPSGLSEVLVPYLSHSGNINHIDFRKSVFIFLNNYGGEQIHDIIGQNGYTAVQKDDDTAVQKEDDTAVQKDLLEKSKNLSNDIEFDKNHALKTVYRYIDYFVPFLPLGRAHVEQCVGMEINQSHSHLSLAKRSMLIKSVANEMQYEGLFSITGCKMVLKKLDLYL